MFHWVVDGGQEDMYLPFDYLLVIVQFFVWAVGEAEGDANHPSREFGVCCICDGGWFNCHIIGS